MHSAAEIKFIGAVRHFKKAGGTPERICYLLAEILGEEFTSSAGRILRSIQDDLSNLPKTRQKLDQAKLVDVTKIVTKNLLSMVMPNGKELRDCTGRDCKRMGGWFARIAKRVKPTQKVGNALSEEQIQDLMSEKKAA